jgi:hypothetical protein
MGSDSIGNDGLVDALRDFGGVLSMESASSRLGPKVLLALKPTAFSELNVFGHCCCWILRSTNDTIIKKIGYG